MKKIKGLLLFGILTLLGIGSSFSQFYELLDSSGTQLILPRIFDTSNTPRSHVNFYLGNNIYTSSTYTSYNHGSNNIYACYNSYGNIVGFKDTRSFITFGNTGTCPSLSSILTDSSISSINPSTGTNGILTFNYLYLSSSTPISPYSERRPANISSYIYFDFNNLHTNYGTFQDVPDGYIRNKLFLNSVGNYGIVSKSLSDGSFSFTSIFRDSFVFNENTDTLDSLNVYSGILLLHFNDYSNDYYGGSHTLLLFLNEDSISYNYYTGYWSFYEDFSYYNVLPASKGFLTYNNSISSGYSQFIDILVGNSNIILSNGDFSNNFLQFTTYSYKYLNLSYAGSGFFTQTGIYNFGFSEDSFVPDFIDVSQGGGNQFNYSGSVSLTDCIDTQICYNYTGSEGNIIRMCTTECVSSGVIASGGYIGSDGTYYFVNSPISIEDSLKTDNPANMFTGSYIDSGGILSLSYFTDYFQPGAKKIGVCPFKYYEGPLDFMTKVKVGDVYLLMPILCFYSAFQQGKDVSFFDQYNVNDGLFSQPLLYGESDNHKLLFAFFDILFSIGLLGLIRYLSRHLF